MFLLALLGLSPFLAAGISGLVYQLVVAAIVVCLLLLIIWVINTYIPLPAPIKTIAVIVVAIILIIYLVFLALQLSGLG